MILFFFSTHKNKTQLIQKIYYHGSKRSVQVLILIGYRNRQSYCSMYSLVQIGTVQKVNIAIFFNFYKCYLIVTSNNEILVLILNNHFTIFVISNQLINRYTMTQKRRNVKLYLDLVDLTPEPPKAHFDVFLLLFLALAEGSYSEGRGPQGAIW